VDILTYLMEGFSNVLQPAMLLICLIGVIMGTLIGVLPGLGPSAAIAIMLPITYGMDPLVALVMLSGMFYGSAYGGAITSILINVPGEGASVATTFDGYPLARKGQPGVALGISAVASFFAGTLGVILLTMIAQPLSRWGLKFGPPEYFTVILFAFIAIVGLDEKGLLKSFFALFLGLLLATVGYDVQTGIPRLTFGSLALRDGISFLPAAVGLFGLSEIVYNFVHPGESVSNNQGTKLDLRSVFPKLHHLIQSFLPMCRGSLVGFFVGVLPGAGANIASFMAYGIEKKISKRPEEFGTGVLEGVAAPEAANNSACSGSFVPLLALGIPGSGTTAVLLGAFILLGIQPGPELFTKHPDVVWGLIASMYIGNIMLIVLNTAFIPLFVWILKISRSCLSVVVTTVCFIGVYSIHYSMMDIWLMLFFTLIGYAFKANTIPPAPLILALILGARAEDALRQSLIMSMGSPVIFLTRPISVTLIVVSLAFLIIPQLKNRLSKKQKIV
jgi:putative tricarboxylic transport membrane protein